MTDQHKPKKPSNRNLAQEIVRGKLDEETIKQAVEELIQILLYAEKDLWAYCPQCRKKVPVPQIDAKTKIDALRQLQELGWGRPRADEDEKRVGFTLSRVIVRPEIEETDGSG